MKTIISFFLGLVIIISGDEFNLLSGFEYASLFCNIVGICFIVYSIKKYADRYLDNQKELLQYREDIRKNFAEISQKMVTRADADLMFKNIEMIGDYQIKSENTIKDLINKCDEFINVYKTTAFSIEEKMKEISSLNSELVNCSNQGNENLDKLHSDFGVLGNEIQALLENIDELTEKINGYMLDLTDEIKDLMQGLSSQDKKRTAGFKDMLEDITDSTKSYNGEVAEHIKKLGQQYAQFESIVEKLIQQITLMSKNDYEVMKRFLNV